MVENDHCFEPCTIHAGYTEDNVTFLYCVKAELDLPASQIMGLHNRMIKKFVQVFMALEESKISSQLKEKDTALPEMDPVVESLDKELVRISPCGVNYLFLIRLLILNVFS